MAFGDKRLFIARQIRVEVDDYGMEKSIYQSPQEYRFSYMPISSQTDYQIYGTLINNMYASILPKAFLGKIKVGDKAYMVDGETQNIDELVAKDLNDNQRLSANYKVKVVQDQNVRVKIIFEKIKIVNK